MDSEAALARLFGAQVQRDAAQRHGAKARAIAEAIEKSLESSGLEARFHMCSDSHWSALVSRDALRTPVPHQKNRSSSRGIASAGKL
jgi:hypothetical protein